MSNYTQVNDYSAKDALATGDANKVIKGSDIDAEFSAISTAIISKADTAGDTFSGAVTFDGNVTGGSSSTLDFEAVTDFKVATAPDTENDTTVASTGFVRNMLPAGVIIPYAVATSPDTTIWLVCDGAAVSRTTYSVLFALIATTYGTGDGSTTFNVPDLRGRFPLCLDNLGVGSANRVVATEADNIGQSSGAETKTLSAGNHASHTHGLTSLSGLAGSGSSRFATSGSLASTANGGTTSAQGSGTAVDAMTPYLSVAYLIKT